MLSTVNKVIYTLFGLRIKSEILLPEAIRRFDGIDIMDVKIVMEDIVIIEEEWTRINKYFVMRENEILFQVPDVATFLMQDGKKIIVSPTTNANEDQLRLYLLGTCMGVILLQRKTLPLHGSVIAIDGKAYAIVGDSGAGKSTLASAFLNEGYQLLTDDVIAVQFDENNRPMVIPSYPQQKLWQESLDHFGADSANYRPLFARETKFSVPVGSKFYHEPLQLAGIFELIKSDSHEVHINPIEGLDRLHALFYHTYRNFLIEPLGLTEWHFKTSASMISNLDFYQLHRPVSSFTVYELQNLILDTIQLEKQHGLEGIK